MAVTLPAARLNEKIREGTQSTHVELKEKDGELLLLLPLCSSSSIYIFIYFILSLFYFYFYLFFLLLKVYIYIDSYIYIYKALLIATIFFYIYIEAAVETDPTGCHPTFSMMVASMAALHGAAAAAVVVYILLHFNKSLKLHFRLASYNIYIMCYVLYRQYTHIYNTQQTQRNKTLKKGNGIVIRNRSIRVFSLSLKMLPSCVTGTSSLFCV